MDDVTSNEVPPVTDFDHHDASLTREDVLEAYADMREQCPIVHSPRYGGYFHVTRHGAVCSVTSDPDSFSSADGIIIPPAEELPPIPPLEMEGGDRKWWRNVMQPPLRPAEVRKSQPAIDAIVREQIDTFAQEGEAELVSALADTIPALVIARTVGLSAEAAPRMRKIALAVLASLDTGEVAQATQEFFEFTASELETRRRDPTDDYLSQLAAGTFGGRPLNDIEVGGLLVAYFIGGHHSTAASISGLLHHIMTERGVREALLEDPKALPGIIEESLRLTTPLVHFARTALQDTEVEGVPISAGSRLLINYMSANRDSRVFDEPERFDYRRGRNPHLAFGHGVHLCIGSHLARAQLASVATQLFGRLPDIHIHGDARFTGLTGGTLMEISELPVRFTPEVAST